MNKEALLKRIGEFTGNMSAEEGLALMHLAAQSPGDILEIGAYMGKSTSYLSLGAHESDARLFPRLVYTIDLWDFRVIGHEKSIKPGGKAELRQWHSPETYKQFIKNIGSLGTDNVISVKGISQEIAKIWDLPLGMVFIDGAHDYKSLCEDYDGFTEHLVAPGGILAIHDYVLNDVHNFIDEIVIPSGMWTNIKFYNGNLFTAIKGDDK